ncbi:LAMI_0F02102g1_1 [Lachancea mirantina]|uniref:LAMI_0F02102g1_1 n=1 Tax=Lachancea mirantina TaxID=1230905 RepID=A0A1G4JW80_9SACH|nr:LAMI_0F02102g1_1 [Lachancea mirantina]
MSDEEESKRISVQVSSLSTQLIQSIDKQSHLEEQLLQAKRTISNQSNALNSLEALKTELEQLKSSHRKKMEEMVKCQNQLVSEIALRQKAQDDASRLNKEVEDLTASLFDEANKMVAEARKATHEVEIKNTRLSEQIKEKDLVLETLSLQLKNLKKVLYNLDSNKDSNVQKNSSNEIPASSNVSSGLSISKTPSNVENTWDTNVIFSPNLQTLRYDLLLYTEFLKFIAALPSCSSIKETAANSKLLKRLVNDEIQPILRLDNANGLGWYIKRHLMSLMIQGLVAIQPISGINETYRAGYTSPQTTGITSPALEAQKERHLFNYPVNSPPVAVQTPCAICSENRDDILEHGRLYVIKILKSEVGIFDDETEFPLCHYCLLKIRQTCDIFAFLRSLKSGAWSLEKVVIQNPSEEPSQLSDPSSSSQIATNEPNNLNTTDKLSKRLSFLPALNKQNQVQKKISIQAGPDFWNKEKLPSTNVQRAWAQLCKLRSSLHWAHIGIWSLDDAVSAKIGPVHPHTEEERGSHDLNSGLGISRDAKAEGWNSNIQLDAGSAFNFESEVKSQEPQDTSKTYNNDSQSILESYADKESPKTSSDLGARQSTDPGHDSEVKKPEEDMSTTNIKVAEEEPLSLEQSANGGIPLEKDAEEAKVVEITSTQPQDSFVGGTRNDSPVVNEESTTADTDEETNFDDALSSHSKQ